MRTKEEILHRKKLPDYNIFDNSDQDIMIELLLDIRELLEKKECRSKK